MCICQQCTYLSQDFWIDDVGCLGVLLVFRQENPNISTAFHLGEHHIELSMREYWHPVSGRHDLLE